jgi:hypothetical protein
LGWPASTTRRPSRSSALAGPAQHRVHRGLDGAQLAARIGLLQEVDLLLGEVQRGLHQHAQGDDALGQGLDLLREGAGQRAGGAARGGLGAGVDQVGHRLGLGQVQLVVQEGALGELARLGQAQGQPSAAPALRQRASSSCSTTGPPWACSSSTSSPV